MVVNASNTVTIADVLIEDVYGPSAIDIGAVEGNRVDIVQVRMQLPSSRLNKSQAIRVTTNQVSPSANASVTWVDC